MKFRNDEERHEYAVKVSGLTEIGFAFYIIGTAIKSEPNRIFTEQAREWREIRAYIPELYRLGVITQSSDDLFRIVLTVKGESLLPRYQKANETYLGIMNDFN